MRVLPALLGAAHSISRKCFRNGERAMAYGHAERNLALLRQLEAETRQLLESVDEPDPELSAWLQEVTSRGDDR
jgi:hypothetical protein